MSEIPPLNIRYLPTGALTPNPRNARIHPKKQIAKLKAAIRKVGFRVPIIVDADNVILAGHGRHQAATELGMAEVPVTVFDDLTEADRRAFMHADNLIGEKGDYDRETLRLEVGYLTDVGYQVELTGLDTIEIDRLLGSEPAGDRATDDIVPLPAVEPPITQTGDCWTWGDQHRLVVGDARDPEVIERLMDGEQAELVFTDPPYGCAIVNNVSGLGKVRHDNFVMGAGQESLPELAMTILRPTFRNIAAHCRPGAVAFVCSDWRAAPHMLDAARGVFDEVKNTIVWVKTNAGMGTFYRSQFELIMAFRVSPGRVINNFGLGEGGRHRSNVWTYAGANTFRSGRMKDLIDHPTVKPKKMVADALLDCSQRGGIVLDVFAGSGTTLVAAAMTGRRGYGVEIDPRYADVILARMTEETGLTPMLGGVSPFDVVAAQRRAADREARP